MQLDAPQHLSGLPVQVVNIVDQPDPLPAVITRVHSLDAQGVALCNLTVLTESGVLIHTSSIFVYPSGDTAAEYLRGMVGRRPIVAWQA